MRSVKHLAAAAVGLVAATIVVQTGSPVAALEGNRERILNAYSRLPLAFVETPGASRFAGVVLRAGLPVRVPLHTKTDGNVMGFARDRPTPISPVPGKNSG